MFQIRIITDHFKHKTTFPILNLTINLLISFITSALYTIKKKIYIRKYKLLCKCFNLLLLFLTVFPISLGKLTCN